MKNLRIPVILLTLLLITSGCASATYEITGYTSSSINADIPVPTNAKSLKVTTDSANPNIKISETYELEHIGGEQGLYTPADYFQKLHDEGWVELKENRMGHVHFLKKTTR
ncbi:hypothetical protein N6H13_06105 [Paenibacillus sp. CC-CFT742]|nr:hypothetical protein [Paenibacillus sp. CC-CFT742]WJH30255.1 hypothetical protein N6H13_06105 [Paenibacillus sp. CC-CFT742]